MRWPPRWRLSRHELGRFRTPAVCAGYARVHNGAMSSNEIDPKQPSEENDIEASDSTEVPGGDSPSEDAPPPHEDDDYDDSMDGDHDSAMASAGFGTDEDYGYYGEEY